MSPIVHTHLTNYSKSSERMGGNILEDEVVSSSLIFQQIKRASDRLSGPSGLLELLREFNQ